MKKVFIFLMVTTACSFTTIKSSVPKFMAPTAGIYLFIGSTPTTATLTAGAGIIGNMHGDEVEIQAISDGISVAIGGIGGGGGATVGKASISDINITKFFDLSSLRIKNALIKGTHILLIEMRYYDGIKATPVYKIALHQAYVTSNSEAGTDCLSGCPGTIENLSFAPTIIDYINYIPSTPQILTYNISTNLVTSSGL